MIVRARLHLLPAVPRSGLRDAARRRSPRLRQLDEITCAALLDIDRLQIRCLGRKKLLAPRARDRTRKKRQDREEEAEGETGLHLNLRKNPAARSDRRKGCAVTSRCLRGRIERRAEIIVRY
jgi:hypothetical protein